MRPQNSPMGRERNGGRRGEEREFHCCLHLSSAILLLPVIPNSVLSLCLYTLLLGKDIKTRNSSSEVNSSVPNKGEKRVLKPRDQGSPPCFPAEEDG